MGAAAQLADEPVEQVIPSAEKLSAPPPHTHTLEAQWAEPVSLTFHSVLRNLYKEPFIDSSYQVSVHLAKRFQRRRLKLKVYRRTTTMTNGRRTPSDGNSSRCLYFSA